MTTIKIERKEEKRRAIKIVVPNTENMNAEEKTEILETEERKTDRMMIITRETSMTANEKIEEEEKNDGIRIGTVIRGTSMTAKTDRKGEVRGTKTASGEEITARDRKEEVEGTSTAIGSIGIVIVRGKGPRRRKTIRDIGTGRTSVKENGERN